MTFDRGFAGCQRRPQGICLPSHASYAAIRVPENGGTAGKKGDVLDKNFSSQRGGLPLHFLQMNHPGRILEMGFFNPRLSRTAICNHQPVLPDTL
jgi:hypothetical protein